MGRAPRLARRPPDWEIETPEGTKAEAARQMVRGLGFRQVSLREGRVQAVRRRWAALGTFLFHGAFFLVALGFLATFVARQEARIWVGAVRRHLRSRYVTPPEFLDRVLVTRLRVVLTADGEVLGAPEVVAGSGDPFFDDNAIRTAMNASPLPPPPEAGTWTFDFSSESRR